MFDTTTTAIPRTTQPFAWPQTINGNVDVGPADVRQSRLAAERALDEALAESFPASDPPSWTLGVVRPAPAARAPSGEVREEPVADTPAAASGMDVTASARAGLPRDQESTG